MFYDVILKFKVERIPTYEELNNFEIPADSTRYNTFAFQVGDIVFEACITKIMMVI